MARSSGGGKRLESSCQRGEETEEDTKLLRHYGTKVVSKIKDVRTIRRKDDKSETEAISRHSEAHSQSAEWLQKTRRSAGLFCNYLARLTRMRILQAKESSLLQYKAAAKNENNSTEIDHASMPLGIFASKPVSCRHSVLELLLARNCHSYCCRRYEFRYSLPELYTRPQFRNADLHKRVAYTLAEVLITLGIIGVVAAVTLPSVIQNYKKQEVLSRLKKSYAVIEQTVKMAEKDYGTITTWPEWSDSEAVLHKYFVPYLSGVKEFGKTKSVEIALCYDQNSSMTFDNVFKYYSQYVWWTGVHISNPFSAGETSSIALSDGTCIGLNPKTDSHGVKPKMIFVDVNGSRRGPNVAGKDLFFFYINSDGFVKPWGDGYQEVLLKNLCNSQSSSQGYTCAARIIREGWQINYW